MFGPLNTVALINKKRILAAKFQKFIMVLLFMHNILVCFLINLKR